MNALTVLDLESAADPAIGKQVVDAVARAAAYEVDVATIDDLAPMQRAQRLFVTGSACMLDDVPWADEVAAAVETAARCGTPVLAVCFGHQLMARHFGGRIGSFDDVRRGVLDIRFDGSGPFPEGVLPLVHSHRDHVLDAGDLVPAGTGGFGGIAATRHPRLPLWTCQGHPEWDAAVCKAVHAAWDEPDGVLDTRAAKRIVSRVTAWPIKP